MHSKLNTWINKICLFFSIYNSAVISFDDKVVLFGGYGNGQVSTVAAFIGERWFKIGDLKQNRYQHNAIRSGTEVIIVGGSVLDGRRL